MKKLSFLFTAFLMAALTHAQSSMLATLSHEGEISTYYGANALKDAFNASQNGDVITLSGGSFNAIDITKAVTIRGNGMSADNTSGSLPTILLGDFRINIPTDVKQPLTIEGISNSNTVTIKNLNNAMFLKDHFLVLSEENGNSTNILSFIHCKISSRFTLYGTASFINSYIGNPTCYGVISFTNCIVAKNNSGAGTFTSKTSSFNSIFVYTSHLSGNAIYCLGVSAENIFSRLSNSTNKITSNVSDVFKTYTGAYDDMENFELTEEAIKKYKGNDGTEVGIYGGSLPFSPTPSNPQITKCKVASKSTADGKLSVDIEVSASE